MTTGSSIDGWFWSRDSLRLHYRVWPARADVPSDRPALLCLPGLTRNSSDFAALASRLDGQWRVVAADLRGRGESAYAKDSLTYVPLSYLLDLRMLIESAGLTRFVVIGTSLGGTLAMLLTVGHQAQMAGVILNDAGPVVEPEGLRRLRANVGRSGNWPTWLHAARDIAMRNAAVYPEWALSDWLAFAKRICRLAPSGRIVFDYDSRIAEPFRLPGADAGIDLWAAFDGLRGLPVLLLRGARSDVLSAETAGAMHARHRGMTVVEVPAVGHAPTLGEPVAAAAIDRFLAGILAGEVR